MSYALNVDPDAWRALLRLPLDAQEDVLDLLERIVSEQPIAGAPPGLIGAFHHYYRVATDGSRLLVEIAVVSTTQLRWFMCRESPLSLPEHS